MELFMVFKHLAPLRAAAIYLPMSLTSKLLPSIVGFTQMRALYDQQITKLRKDPKLAIDAEYPIIYTSLLDPSAQKGHPVPSHGSLLEEAIALVMAGTDTTGATMECGTFETVRQPHFYKRLKAELKEAWPSLNDRPKYRDLQKLPYLTAVIKESLRIAPTTTSENSRQVPQDGAMISGSLIPPNTIVSMGVLFPQTHSSVWEDPRKFVPERWLRDDIKEKEKYWVPFSKGPRACLGINLAHTELYLVFANLFRRFDLTLDGTK